MVNTDKIAADTTALISELDALKEKYAYGRHKYAYDFSIYPKYIFEAWVSGLARYAYYPSHKSEINPLEQECEFTISWGRVISNPIKQNL